MIAKRKCLPFEQHERRGNGIVVADQVMKINHLYQVGIACMRLKRMIIMNVILYVSGAQLALGKPFIARIMNHYYHNHIRYQTWEQGVRGGAHF